MEQKGGPENIGHQLGADGVQHVEQRVADYCAHERQRIDLANKPRMLVLRGHLALLREEEQDLQSRIHRAPPVGELRARRRKARFYWAITLLLSVAAFFFSALALAPYRLGWKGWLYCLGMAVVTPFLVEKVLEIWASPALIKTLTTIACVAAVVSLMLLAVVRGDLLSQQLSTTNSVVTFDLDGPATPPNENTFYGQTLGLLRCVMAFLALGMEVGAGLALYEARRSAAEGEDVGELQAKLRGVRQQMAAPVEELEQREKEGARFEEQFWRDFSHSMLNGAKKIASKKVAISLLCVGLLGGIRASAAESLTLVVLVDLTASVNASGPDQETDAEKNFRAVSRLLSQAPPGAKIIVVAITEASFTRPELLVSVELNPDEGFFHEKLSAARSALLKNWQQRSKGLRASAPHTDIIGALFVASEISKAAPESRRIVVIFSDMREESRLLDLEHPSAIKPQETLALVERQKLIPDLAGVEVYALGVDAAGKSIAYWESLRDFWQTYFNKAGATLRQYSILREPPSLACAQR